MRAKNAQLKAKSLLECFAAFCVSLVLGAREAADCHIVGRVIRAVGIVVFFSTSRRCSRKRSANFLSVSPVWIFLRSVQVMQ